MPALLVLVGLLAAMFGRPRPPTPLERAYGRRLHPVLGVAALWLVLVLMG